MNQDFLQWLSGLTVDPYLGLLGVMNDPYSQNNVGQQMQNNIMAVARQVDPRSTLLSRTVGTLQNNASNPYGLAPDPYAQPIVNRVPQPTIFQNYPVIPQETNQATISSSIPQRMPQQQQYSPLSVGGIFPASLATYRKAINPMGSYPSRSIF